MRRVDGRTVLVTGGTEGIGRVIAEHLASLGYRLALSYSGDEEAAAATRARVAELGAEATATRADSRQRGDVEQLFAAASARFGDLYAVIANAGIEDVEAPFADMAEDAFDRVVDINVKGTFFTLQQAARHVVDHGRVIATGSTSPGERRRLPKSPAWRAPCGPGARSTILIATVQG